MDTLILIVLLVGAVIGFVQGAFKQIANFLGVTVGIVLAVALYDQFGHYLADATGALSFFWRKRERETATCVRLPCISAMA